MNPPVEPVCAHDDLLRQIHASLQQRIGPQRYNAWFKHGAELTLDDHHLRVTVPNPFTANWIEQHYQSDLIASAEEHLAKRLAVVVAIDPNLTGQCRKRDLDLQAKLVSRAAQGQSRPRTPEPAARLKHTLDDFVVGPSNRLAYSAALAAADRQNHQFTQLFVHGACGVGKTHLLQGICDAVTRRDGRTGDPIRWRYVTGEQFTNEFVAAVRSKQSRDFRDRYRRLDLLAIDDVHFLAAKRATQEEFLHTFNAIQSAGKRILLASDAHPRMVGDLNEQLISRFLAGMVVRIDAPDRQTCLSILRAKAEAMRLTLPRDVEDYLARHIRGSVRELEGTLVKLSALAALEGGRITLEQARDALADHLARTDSVITLGDVEAVVATFFGVTPADLHSSRRTRTVSTARMIAMYLARRYTRMSFPEIGRFMGKNHSSAVLAVQRMENLLARGEEIVWTTPAGQKTMPAEELLDLLNGQIG
ncbi:MAG: chromosomal replication initiator protein DnaA [Phycisphaerae bacterium]|nr:chromosomal replication initiator protein DnaA [Phycisphaerae bacterium]